MDDPEKFATASRLCEACGMCCNGVMFFGAVLQPGDDPRALAALGLRIKKQGGVPHLLQPCSAHQNGGCTVYNHRPVRCRVFVCRQLMDLASGATTEPRALEKIREAGELVTQIRRLFAAAGDTREHKAFVTRFAGIFAEPHDPSPEATKIREQLEEAMKRLEELLDKDFRTE